MNSVINLIQEVSDVAMEVYDDNMIPLLLHKLCEDSRGLCFNINICFEREKNTSTDSLLVAMSLASLIRCKISDEYCVIYSKSNNLKIRFNTFLFRLAEILGKYYPHLGINHQFVRSMIYHQRIRLTDDSNLDRLKGLSYLPMTFFCIDTEIASEETNQLMALMRNERDSCYTIAMLNPTKEQMEPTRAIHR